MNSAKLETELALEAKALPLDVVIECLTLRESRQSIDMVRDGVEAELHKVYSRLRFTLSHSIPNSIVLAYMRSECSMHIHDCSCESRIYRDLVSHIANLNSF